VIELVKDTKLNAFIASGRNALTEFVLWCAAHNPGWTQTAIEDTADSAWRQNYDRETVLAGALVAKASLKGFGVWTNFKTGAVEQLSHVGAMSWLTREGGEWYHAIKPKLIEHWNALYTMPVEVDVEEVRTFMLRGALRQVWSETNTMDRALKRLDEAFKSSAIPLHEMAAATGQMHTASIDTARALRRAMKLKDRDYPTTESELVGTW
jgi:hypothetical protein